MALLLCLFVPAFSFKEKAPEGFHVIKINNPAALKEFFHYTKDRIPFISSHRGGPKKGLPENCLATFENTIRHTWSLIEMDPHYTKDSAIVLMHDATLDRTSNGHGKVSDHTLAEIKKMKLKDPDGNLTNESIPTLDEVLEWAKGKTVLVMDQKDVPMEVRVQKIREHHAQANTIVMAYNLADAKKCYELDKHIMMELVFVPDLKAAAAFDQSGIPWSNVVVFVTHTEPKDKEIFNYIHGKGAMCIRGSSRTIDKQFTDGGFSNMQQLYEKYQRLVKEGADIIEADLGVEAGEAIAAIQNVKSSKSKYFTQLK